MAGLFNAEITEKIRQGLCTLLTEGDDLFQWIGKEVFGKEVGDAITEGEEDQLGLLQRLLGRGVCDKALDWEPNIPSSNFTGGQCEGVLYAVGFDYTVNGIFYSDAPIFVLEGAITSINLSLVTTGLDDDVYAQISHAGGITEGSIRGVPAGSTLDGWSVREVVRRDGLPDTCGNPRPVITDDTPPSFETDIEYDDENGIPQTINNTTFILGNVNISPNGNVSIGFNNSDLELQGDINIFPQYGVTYRNPIRPNDIPVKKFNEQGTGTDIPEENLSESEDVVEIEEDSLPIVAVIVKTQKESFAKFPYTFIPNGDAPQLIVPRIAWVSFKIRKGDETAWTTPTDIKTVDGIALCDDPEGAIAYSIQWARGWKGKSYAILGKPLSELVCCEKQATPNSGT